MGASTNNGRDVIPRRRATGVACALFALVLAPAHAAERQSAGLADLSLEQLANIEVTSVSKRPERLSDAAASVYVITQEDIRRSGATSIPEILRLAPNLQIARVDSSQYAISARGFNSTTANKLLVLIDGRSVYTPLFSGVFWDVQDTMIEDIERVEVISGPGGTQWGSNAVNGVINIITRSSRETQGALASVGVGGDERSGGVRYGGKLGENGTYRLYAKKFLRDNTVRRDETSVPDAWHMGQAGFRMDWGGAKDAVTFQGDVYDGSIDQALNDDKTVSGGNLLARWNRTLEGGSSLQVQAYIDNTRRNYPGSFAETLDTYDLDVQHRVKLGDHEVVSGGGYRLLRDDVTNSAGLAFLPAQRDLRLANLFIQDTITLTERVKLTAGAKFEHNIYTGGELQPNARLGWRLDDRSLLWGSVARVVRTPSRLDRELFVPASAPFVLAGGPTFESEKLTAYEIGYRAQPSLRASFSVSGYYNMYDRLRSLEPGPGGLPPLVISNLMEGETYGVETWGSYQLYDWWRVTAGYNHLTKDLRFKPGSRDASGVQAAGNDPGHQFSLRSQMSLAARWELDVGLRSIGDLPNPQVPGYTELDLRLGWRASRGLEISLVGRNLLDARHPEFGVPATRSEIGRSVFLKLLWRQ